MKDPVSFYQEEVERLIVGMGLLLDANQIPIGMKMYPGNESKKPILRDVINGLKKSNNIIGKTIHVADKELNCAENIVHSLKDQDTATFSLSLFYNYHKSKNSGYCWMKDGKKKEILAASSFTATSRV